MAELRILPPCAKYLKKIKDKKLLALYKKALEEISINPKLGQEKKGDLAGVRSYDIYYNKTKLRISVYHRRK